MKMPPPDLSAIYILPQASLVHSCNDNMIIKAKIIHLLQFSKVKQALR